MSTSTAVDSIQFDCVFVIARDFCERFRRAGKFSVVQTFMIFADGPTTAKIKTVNV